MFKITITDLENGKTEDTLVTGDEYVVVYKDVNKTGVAVAMHASKAGLDVFAKTLTITSEGYKNAKKDCDSCGAKEACDAVHNLKKCAGSSENLDDLASEIARTVNNIMNMSGKKEASVHSVNVGGMPSKEFEALIEKLRKRG
jgi:hypothetical protein